MCGSQRQQGRAPHRRRSLALVLAAVAVVVVGAPVAAWEAWWPANVDARALDDFGPPTPGATRNGPDWVSKGNALCFDVCTTLARSFAVPANLTVGQVLSDAEEAARHAGYTIPDWWARRTRLAC